MMTIEEARKILDDIGIQGSPEKGTELVFLNGVDLCEVYTAIQYAIQALKKQISIKPRTKPVPLGGVWKMYKCPSCEMEVDRDDRFCRGCGQALGVE